MLRRSFRLLTEPASLKPRVVSRVVREHARGFRLLTEPASLKRPTCPVPTPTPTSPGFRLLTEPASLKRGVFSVQRDDLDGFPAPHRAGLIEASGAGLGARARARFRLLTEPASLKLRPCVQPV